MDEKIVDEIIKDSLDEKITFLEGTKVLIEETIPEKIIPAEVKTVEYDLDEVKDNLVNAQQVLFLVNQRLADMQKARDAQALRVEELNALIAKIEAVIPKPLEELVEE